MIPVKWRFLILGVFLVPLGLGAEKTENQVVFLFLALISFAAAFYFWRRASVKQASQRKMRRPEMEPGPTKWNPPHRRFSRELRGWRFLIGGVFGLSACLCTWKESPPEVRVFLLVISPICLALSFYSWRSASGERPRQPKMRRPEMDPEPRPTKRNPPAELPPRRNS